MRSDVELDALTLLPEAEARRALGDRPLELTLLRPPYAALGVGVLRVLRIRRGASHPADAVVSYAEDLIAVPSTYAPLRMTVGYDNYERLN